MQEASNEYRTLARAELKIPSVQFATSRYSLVEAYPHTGRFHQIRKHFAHIFHPVIGDRPHGCNKQNKLFKEMFGFTTYDVACIGNGFLSSIKKKEVTIQSNIHSEFLRMMFLMGWEKLIFPEFLPEF